MRRLALILLTATMAACGSRPAATAGPGTTPEGDGSPTTIVVPAECPPPPLTVPTLPEEIPGYAQLDPATGLHVTGSPVAVDISAYRLSVTGRVASPLRLTYDELRCLPKVQSTPELVCPGYFVDVARWAGAPLREVLDRAGLAPDATALRFVSADGYSQEIELSDDLLAHAFLAYELEGGPLPVLHGFPVRLVWPGRQGNEWVKWLVAIEVV